jgi:hypothetical protein
MRKTYDAHQQDEGSISFSLENGCNVPQAGVSEFE